jgi:hypothetical protein
MLYKPRHSNVFSHMSAQRLSSAHRPTGHHQTHMSLKVKCHGCSLSRTLMVSPHVGHRRTSNLGECMPMTSIPNCQLIVRQYCRAVAFVPPLEVNTCNMHTGWSLTWRLQVSPLHQPSHAYVAKIRKYTWIHGGCLSKYVSYGN